MLYIARRGHGLTHHPQTNYYLIKYFQRSITKNTAAMRGFNRSHYYCTKKRAPMHYSIYNTIKPYTFPILSEIELRLARMQSVLRSDFLRTHRPAALGLTSPAMLDKFRAGLTSALLAADELADFGASVSEEAKAKDAGLTFEAWVTEDDMITTGEDARYLDEMPDLLPEHRKFIDYYDNCYYQTLELRQRQRQRISHFSTRLLCWMVTLAAGCGQGTIEERQGNSLEVDPSELDMNEDDDEFVIELATKEAVLRHGTKFLWMRHGAGRWDQDFAWGASSWFVECKHDFELFDETGGVIFDMGAAPGLMAGDVELPHGLHMSIMGELRDRIIAHRHHLAEIERTFFDETSWTVAHTMNVVHKLVGTEIGFPQWRGYEGLGKDPPPPKQPLLGGFFL